MAVEAPAAPARIRVRPAGLRRFALRRLQGLASLAAFILVWHVLVAILRPNPILFPSPSAVWSELVEVGQKGLLWPAVIDSSRAMAIGLALAVVAGILIGIPTGASQMLDTITSPYFWALFATPRIALTPLVVLWLGIGLEAKVWLVFLSAVIPLILSCQEGVKTVDESLVRAARSFGAGRRHLLLHVVTPSILPFIASGVRNGISRGFVGLLVVEMTVGSGGIGTQVMRAMRSFNSARMIAFVAVLVAGALLLIGLSRKVEERLSRWRPEVAI